MNQNGSPWTEERTATAKRLWIEGRSASEIANALGGVTRCGVIGRLHRAGVSGSAGSHPRPRNPRVPIDRSPSAPRRARRATFFSSPPTPGIIRPPTFFCEPEPPGGVQLMELTRSMCRWPIGDPNGPDFRFCGAGKVEPGAYCQRHHAKAYEPTSSAKALERSVRRYAA